MSDLPHSPAAERNVVPILGVLRDVLPPSGLVLEVASGTGQHVVRFAEDLPNLTFQPSDRSEESIAVVSERVRRAGLANLREPVVLDAARSPWPIDRADAIVCINMVHICPWEATLGLLDGAAAVLTVGAAFILYGPFVREGIETAPGNLAFDADLRRRDPAWGLRDLGTVTAEARARGFGAPEIRELPTNNLAVVCRREG